MSDVSAPPAPPAPNGAAVKKSLVAKLAEVMAAVERVPKRGRNDYHGYDYATEADIAATIRKELANRNVMLLPGADDMARVPVGDKGSVLTTLKMSFTFLDGDTGEQLTRPWYGAGTDKEDKGLYKAMTGGEKYFLLKTFLMPTGDDPERDEKGSQEAAGARRGRSTPGPRPGLPAAQIGDPDRPAGDPEAHREESERLFTDQGALPSLSELVQAFRDGRKQCPACHEPYIIKGKAEFGGGWVCWAKRGVTPKACGWKCKDEISVPAPQAPAAAPAAGPGEPVAAGEERRALLLKATKISDALDMSEDMRRTVWGTYCGTATKANVDPAALHELISYLELRAKQKGVPA